MQFTLLTVATATLYFSGAMAQEHCSTCYTKTITGTGIFACPAEPTCAPTPLPAYTITETTVVPDSVCATVTVPPCKTTCQTGDYTTTTLTKVVTDQCVGPSPSSCFTATVTAPVYGCPPVSGTFNCPIETSGEVVTSTVTRPLPNPWCCETPTVTNYSPCPGPCETGHTVVTTVTANAYKA